MEAKIKEIIKEYWFDKYPEDDPTEGKMSNRGARLAAKEIVKLFDIPVVTKRNWFEKLPLHWRYLYYMIGGILIGLLLPYVW